MVDLLLTSFDCLLLIPKNIFFSYKTSCLNVEVNCTEPSLSVRFPWTKSHPIRHREKVPMLSLNFRLFRFRDLLQRIVVEVVVVVDEPVSDGSHASHFAVWIIDGLQKKLR